MIEIGEITDRFRVGVRLWPRDRSGLRDQDVREIGGVARPNRRFGDVESEGSVVRHLVTVSRCEEAHRLPCSSALERRRETPRQRLALNERIMQQRGGRHQRTKRVAMGRRSLRLSRSGTGRMYFDKRARRVARLGRDQSFIMTKLDPKCFDLL